ncbi:dTDP-4-dehydrorhamnose reductase [Vibrio fluvialis]|nr:dTDP-4-dehydrorhamnose reductase [Vibrio fluvialis]
MRILVTGSSGQVGSSLIELLEKETDINYLPLNRSELDITNFDSVEKVVLGFHPDVIVNTAAYTAVDKAELEPEQAYAINSQGVKHLALAAEKINATVVHLSTDYVFSGDKDGLYSESDLPEPLSIYGKSKLDGERELIQCCRKHIILRTAWVFGEHGNNFVKTMLRLAKKESTLSIVSDQFGGPTYAGDIAKAIVNIIRKIPSNPKPRYGVYHYSGFPYVSWSEFAKVIFEKAREEGFIDKTPKVNSIKSHEYPTLATRPSNSRLDTYKINNEFGIKMSDWIAALSSLENFKYEGSK